MNPPFEKSGYFNGGAAIVEENNRRRLCGSQMNAAFVRVSPVL